MKRQYVKPFGSAKERSGALGFAISLLKEQSYFESLWEKRSKISEIPILLIWGMKDKAFPEKYLTKFLHEFTNSKTVRLKECGHFPQEVEPEVVIKYITKFLPK